MSGKINRLLVSTLLIVFLAACSEAAETPSVPSVWQIQINDVEIKESLNTTEVVTLYNGEKDEVIHENLPESGNIFLLLSLDLNKINSEGGSFEWQDLVILDENGGSYNRVKNDSFLDLHGFTPRMTGLSMRFGENSGWICFEIPENVTKGKLYLFYSSLDEEQKIEIKK